MVLIQKSSIIYIRYARMEQSYFIKLIIKDRHMKNKLRLSLLVSALAIVLGLSNTHAQSVFAGLYR